MPPEKDDAAYLWDMLDAARTVRDIVATVHIPELIAQLEPLVPPPPSDPEPQLPC